jgi:hypothetical protein
MHIGSRFRRTIYPRVWVVYISNFLTALVQQI